MPNAAKGYSLAAIENTPLGIQQLLTDTAVSALPASLTSSTALTAATTGMHMLIIVWGHTATGTIALAGTAPNSGGAVTSTTTTLAIPVLGDSPYASYITPEVYATISASGVTLGGGLTNGHVAIFGIQAGSRLIPGEVKLTDKRKDYHVIQQRGTFAQSHMPPLPLSDEPEWEFTADLQPDSTYLLVPAGFSSSVTTTAIPVGGTSLLSSTDISGAGTASLNTQPTAPGMVIQFTIGGAVPSAAHTIAVTGVNLDGETVTETSPSFDIETTWTTTTVWKSVAASGIAFGAFGTSVTLVGKGYFGWSQVAIPTDPIATLSIYQWDSIANKVMPGCLANEWELTWGMDKEAKMALKGPGQILGLMGDVTSASQQGPALVQSQDLAITGWSSVIYLDPLSGTPASTQAISVKEGKIMGKNNWTTLHTDQFYPPGRYYTRAYHNRHEVSVELTLDMLIADYTNQYAGAFKRGTKQYVAIWLRHGAPIATVSSTPYYLGPKFIMTARWEEDPALKYEIGTPNIEITLKATCWWDAPSGYDAQVTWVTRLPSWS